MNEAEEDFRQFVISRWSSLVGVAFLVTTDRGAAEDCVQEALARVHRRWERLTRDGAPEAYVMRSVINAALSWRRRRRVAEVPLDSTLDPAVYDVDPDGPDPALVRALRSLPPRMRAVIVLRFIEDCSEATTAAILGCSVGTVKSTSSRALARLRTALGQEDDGLRYHGRVRQQSRVMPTHLQGAGVPIRRERA
jgi:RNA polymerase sigma-70 factor (sigma-E family)